MTLISVNIKLLKELLADTVKRNGQCNVFTDKWSKLLVMPGEFGSQYRYLNKSHVLVISKDKAEIKKWEKLWHEYDDLAVEKLSLNYGDNIAIDTEAVAIVLAAIDG